MPDNDFWIGQEQIPVDLSLLLTYHNDEDYWYAPGEYALRVYTVDTLNTNFARPCFALGERKFDPEMEDVSVLFHGGKDLPVTELDLAQLRSVDLALMDGASPAEAMRAAEKSTSAEPEAPAASLASEARDAKAARTELDSQSEIKDAPTRAEKADGSL